MSTPLDPVAVTTPPRASESARPTTATRPSHSDRSVSRSGAATGEPDRGTTIRRLVVVEQRTAETLEPALGWQRRVTLPRRGYRANLTLSPPPSTNITAVRANSRVALHDDDGLSGQYEIPLSRFETTTLRFSASGPLPPGSVRIEYDAVRTRKATLAVSADG
jgi:hypothetical protein